MNAEENVAQEENLKKLNHEREFLNMLKTWDSMLVNMYVECIHLFIYPTIH